MSKLRLKVTEVIEIAKKFIRQEAEYSFFRVLNVRTEPSKSQWIVTVDVGMWVVTQKVVVVDDEDGNIIEYR